MTKRTKAARMPAVEFVSYDLPREFPISAVTDFVVRDGPVLKLHVHDCLQIGFCQQGCGVYIIGDDISPFKQGDLYVIPEQQVHFLQARKGTRCLWSWIFLDPLRLVTDLLGAADALGRSTFCRPGIIRIDASPRAGEIIALVTSIIHECRNKEFGYRALTKAQVLVLMTKLYRMQPFHHAHARSPSPGRLQGIAPALRFISGNYGTGIRNADLAAACAMSVRNFNRSFRSILDASPQAYLLRIRLAMACADMQSTSATVRSIAFDNGFQSVSQFNRAFRRAMGASPRQWRRNAGADPSPHNRTS